MRGFGTLIPIDAPADRVWSLLTNAPGYPAWNSTVARIEGRIAPGEKMTLYARPPVGRTFRLRVSGFAAPTRMEWTRVLPLALLTGKRVFTLTFNPEGGVLFSIEENFTGPLVRMVPRWMPAWLPPLRAFADDLKRVAERLG